MNIRKIIKYFERGNVCVVGEKGSGKDMLFANVIARRKLDYISNTRYDRKKGLQMNYYPLDFSKIDCGGNTYKNFLSGDILPYEYPYPLGVDVYIADCGVYMPSQYCNELNRDYKQLPNFFALVRHVAEASVHTNCQNLGRIWDKLREQSRTYITCLKCKVIKIGKKQLVIQKIRIYEKYDSCANNVPALKLPISAVIGKDATMGRLYKLNYRIQHGEILEKTLIYFNESDYDTHVFRDMMKPKGGECPFEEMDL